MTIRITVHNDGATPGSIVAARTLQAPDVMTGEPWFMHPGTQQTFYLHDHQFLVVAEIKTPPRRDLTPPVPSTPDFDVLTS